MTFRFLLSALTVLFLSPLAVAAAPVKDLTINDALEGRGPPARVLDTVEVHYTGWLMDGTKFDSSRDRGQPYAFTIGMGDVIPGWDLGVPGMKVGGKRELLIPFDLAYGPAGRGKTIPPKADLRFEVELVAIAPVKFQDIGNDDLKAWKAKGAKIIDLRRPLEAQESGVIDGSRLIPAFTESGRLYPDFVETFTKAIKPEDTVVLVCRSGNRSRRIATWLAEEKGYGNVANLADGVLGWTAAKLPLVPATPAP
ncbi:MAG: hypothetical protein A2516_04655 [Alphaproteobacteria bacterium RIFOXYD12_FULL_60_8]|nr:MAG: hypothetical protein A2516_04655 [Alphaproteobacteria bacterium RIFOXYD12_FULL_60_8]